MGAAASLGAVGTAFTGYMAATAAVKSCCPRRWWYSHNTASKHGRRCECNGNFHNFPVCGCFWFWVHRL